MGVYYDSGSGELDFIARAHQVSKLECPNWIGTWNRFRVLWEFVSFV